MATAEVIRSLTSPLRTVSLTPVLLPVRSGINDDFGDRDHLNFGGKLYCLLYDTDLDLLFLAGASRSSRFGIDFARNLTSNFVVHGEFAFLHDLSRRVVDATGDSFEVSGKLRKWLLGLRYLSAADTTWIAEYYHNGAGGYGRLNPMRD